MVFPISKYLILAPSRFIFIKKVTGLENLPKNPPYILAANHSSYIDPFLISSIIIPKINKKIRYLTVVNKFYKFLGDFISATWVGCIPLYNKEEALKLALETLNKDGVIGIHPEGRRTHTKNKLLRAHTGAVRLSIFSKAPIIPIAVKNTFDLWPYNQTLPKLKKIVEIEIGKPYYIKPPQKIMKQFNSIGLIGDKHKNPLTYKFLRKETKNLMEKIASLLSQRYIEKKDYSP